jgi:predicted negative regulator of RcsB-dependent stress response
VSAYSQQEELEQFKAWWKNYGVSLAVGVVLGVALLFGYRYWTQYRETQRIEASAIYDRMLDELRASKPEARASGEKLIGEFASTPYAGLAALLLARQAYDAGDRARAQQQLQWALAHGRDEATQHAARLRLARLKLDAGDLPAVAPLIEIKGVAGFEAEYFELRGDLALAQRQTDAARSAYAEALKHLGSNSPYRAALAMKMGDLGSEK